jgi:hypothetical protein
MIRNPATKPVGAAGPSISGTPVAPGVLVGAAGALPRTPAAWERIPNVGGGVSESDPPPDEAAGVTGEAAGVSGVVAGVSGATGVATGAPGVSGVSGATGVVTGARGVSGVAGVSGVTGAAEPLLCDDAPGSPDPEPCDP